MNPIATTAVLPDFVKPAVIKKNYHSEYKNGEISKLYRRKHKNKISRIQQKELLDEIKAQAETYDNFSDMSIDVVSGQISVEMTVLEALVCLNLYKSRNQAKKGMRRGEVRMNGFVIHDKNRILSPDDDCGSQFIFLEADGEKFGQIYLNYS